METSKIISTQEQRQVELLEAGLATADCFIGRNYLINLADQQTLPPDEDECTDSFLRLYHVDRFVFDRKENVNDKLISVYSALHEIDGTAILLIHSGSDGIQFYLGARSNRKATLCGQVLVKTLLGNFPGSKADLLRTSGVTKLMDETVLAKEGELGNVASVSIVPSGRDEDKDKFVQGVEKFIDTMQGENYTAIFISEPVTKTELEYRKRGLEELASSLSPLMKTTLAYGENNSKAVTDGTFENFSQSINRSIANTSGNSKNWNTSDTKGSSRGFGISGLNTSTQRSRTSGYSAGMNWSKAVTEGTADTTGTGTNFSTAVTTGNSKTLTVEYINKSVENLLKTIDQQLERIRSCESFGLWSAAAYFLSPEVQVSVAAASAFKALVSGEKSCVENAYVNVWDARNEHAQNIVKALRYGMHPNILIPAIGNHGFAPQYVTPGSFISGQELPLFMGIPQKSVSGLTVSSIAEFGRNVFTLDAGITEGSLPLGHIFHMGHPEQHKVNLDVNSFTSHCFISGSTGSGKSNTSYVLLKQFYERNIPFLVIEPAKGEYKDAFGKIPGIHIFTTNPRMGKMLRLNPFWFDHEQIHVLEHLDRLIEIFNACWEMYAAMPAILKAGMERIYTERGWDLLNSDYLGAGVPLFPTFSDLLRVLPEVIKTSGYSADTQGDYTGALVTRVASLANGISGQIFCSGSAIDDSVLFDENTIIDLSRVGSTETKSLIMGLLVMKLTEYRTAQATGSNRELRHITVIEEAHNLLKRTGTSQGQETANLIGKSVEMISNSIAEMRTYGEGFIIVDQSPTAVDISAIKNTNTKIIMRLPEKTDCEAVGNAMALNEEQVKELAKLPTGVAAVIQNNWLEAVLVKVDRADNSFQTSHTPADKASLYALRGAAVSQLMHQYFDARKWDVEALRTAVYAVNAPVEKKEEVLDTAFAVVHRIGNGRNIQQFCQSLIDIACCRGVFDIHEPALAKIDTSAWADGDLNQIRLWQEAMLRSVKATVYTEPSRYSFLLRLMVYGKAQQSGCEKYLSYYYALYEPDSLKREIETVPSAEIEKVEIKNQINLNR